MSFLRSPCECFLKYLITHPKRYSDEQIQAYCGEKRLDCVGKEGKEYLVWLRTQIAAPVPFHPTDVNDAPSQLFLNKYRIRSMYFKDESTKMAIRILEAPTLKEWVEGMSICSAPPVLIARGAPAICSSIHINGDGVLRYQHYFWTISLIDKTELRAVIAMRGTRSDIPELKQAHKNDSRRVIAELPFNPISAVIAQIRMGIAPAGINYATLMEDARNLFGIKAYQAALESAPYAADNVQKYMSAALTAAELMERCARPEDKLHEHMRAFRLKCDTDQIPHIKQLSDGRHTMDLLPSKAKESVVNIEEENEDGRNK